jgi:hypothetical protein
MKFKWRRMQRWSVMAPRMTVRRQMPGLWRAALLLLICAGVAGVALGGFDLGRSWTGPRPAVSAADLASAQEQVARLRADRERYSSTVNSAESQISIERSAQRQLSEQIKALQAENGKLKDDLAFFDSLLPVGKGANPAGAVSIRRFKADAEGPNRLRYRLLIMQGGKDERDFSGSVQIAVTVLQKGKSAIMLFPDTAAHDGVAAETFKLSFKRYQRLEGTLVLPQDAEMQTVQARIFEKGQLRTQQSVPVQRS